MSNNLLIPLLLILTLSISLNNCLQLGPIPLSIRRANLLKTSTCDQTGWSCKDCYTLQKCSDTSNFKFEISCAAQFPNKPYCDSRSAACVSNRHVCDQMQDVEFKCPAAGLYPDLTDCRRFVSCSDKGQVGVIYNCLFQSVYNSELKRCKTFSKCYTPIHDCEGQFKTISYKADPSLYVVCRGKDKPLLKYCGSKKFHYNPQLLSCEFICSDEGIFADPLNNHLYYVCVYNNGELVRMTGQCLEGTIFDEFYQTCIDKIIVTTENDLNPTTEEEITERNTSDVTENEIQTTNTNEETTNEFEATQVTTENDSNPTTEEEITDGSTSDITENETQTSTTTNINEETTNEFEATQVTIEDDLNPTTEEKITVGSSTDITNNEIQTTDTNEETSNELEATENYFSSTTEEEITVGSSTDISNSASTEHQVNETSSTASDVATTTLIPTSTTINVTEDEPETDESSNSSEDHKSNEEISNESKSETVEDKSSNSNETDSDEDDSSEDHKSNEKISNESKSETVEDKSSNSNETDSDEDDTNEDTNEDDTNDDKKEN